MKYFCIWLAASGSSIFLPEASFQTGAIVALVSLPATIFFATSRLSVRASIVLTAILGLACAGYLVYGWSGGVTECATGGCAKAQASSYATLFFSLPTSMVGVFGYSLILLTAALPGMWRAVSSVFFGYIWNIGFPLLNLFICFCSSHHLSVVSGFRCGDGLPGSFNLLAAMEGNKRPIREKQ